MAARDLFFLHWVVRKSAHFCEFFVLGCLAYWACRRGRKPAWQLRWALQAFAVAALYSLVDEARQAFIPSRTGSLLDSAVDSLGAAASQVAIYLRHLLRRRVTVPHASRAHGQQGAQPTTTLRPKGNGALDR
jgi:VanZ family protein